MSRPNECKHGYDKDADTRCHACKDPGYIPLDGWLFYVSRPVAIIVKGTFAQAKAAQKVIAKRVLDEGYVHWFDDISGVDRALMTEDPVKLMDNGRVEEY